MTPGADVERLLERRGRLRALGQNVPARGALSHCQQVGGKESFPATKEPEFAGPAASKTVVSIRLGSAGQAAAGRIPARPRAFEGKTVPFRHLPIEAAKADPLIRGAGSWAEEAGQRVEHTRVCCEAFGYRVDAAQP